MAKTRVDGRNANELRPLRITPDYLTHAAGSVLVEAGGTKVLCAVSCEDRVPPWMRAQNVPGGWVTSEYGMLPASTHDRSRREASNGKQGGRTMEIQRLIGRSFRAVVDLMQIEGKTLYIDCDVIDADGGTRCASITGASVALQLAFQKLVADRKIKKNPMKENVAAVSVGIVKGQVLLDLCYEEDSSADVDMNIVMTESGKFVEIQGTAEENPFSYQEMEKLVQAAQHGLKKIFTAQKQIVEAKLKVGANSNGLGNLGELMGNL